MRKLPPFLMNGPLSSKIGLCRAFNPRSLRGWDLQGSKPKGIPTSKHQGNAPPSRCCRTHRVPEQGAYTIGNKIVAVHKLFSWNLQRFQCRGRPHSGSSRIISAIFRAVTPTSPNHLKRYPPTFASVRKVTVVGVFPVTGSWLWSRNKQKKMNWELIPPK